MYLKINGKPILLFHNITNSSQNTFFIIKSLYFLLKIRIGNHASFHWSRIQIARLHHIDLTIQFICKKSVNILTNNLRFIPKRVAINSCQYNLKITDNKAIVFNSMLSDLLIKQLYLRILIISKKLSQSHLSIHFQKTSKPLNIGTWLGVDNLFVFNLSIKLFYTKIIIIIFGYTFYN